MAKDFDAINTLAREKEKERDAFNNAQAGRNTGSTKYSSVKQSQKNTVRADERGHNRLNQLLNIEDYQAAWNSTIALLNEADQAVYDALTLASENLSIAQQEHDALQTQASEEKLQQAQDRYDMIYKHDLRLGEIREEAEALKDTNTPEALEKLQKLDKEIHSIREAATQSHTQNMTYEASTTAPHTAALPKIDMNFT